MSLSLLEGKGKDDTTSSSYAYKTIFQFCELRKTFFEKAEFCSVYSASSDCGI